MNPDETLHNLYEQALSLYNDGGNAPEMGARYNQDCQTIVERQDGNRGTLTVLITLLLKKTLDPDQDIRLHQTQMDSGFSRRSLDTAAVTPFLKNMSFPYMSSGSGWLTRSLEQSLPYNLDYPGNIRPLRVKEAFLRLVDGVQCHKLHPETLLIRIFMGLIRFRDQNANFVLSRLVNLSVSEAVEKVKRHHGVQLQGAARLPVLSIHAF